MMELLDKIYGYEHFGIILFAVIAVLIVLFLIVLFFGKKDEKKRELERTQQLEAQKAAEGFGEVNPEAIALNIEEPIVAPVEDAVTPIAPITEPTPVMPTEPVAPVVEPTISEVPVMEPVIESTPVAPVLEPTVAPAIVTPNEEVVVPTAPVVEPVIQPEIKVEPVSSPIPEVVIEPPVVEEPTPEIKIPNFNFDELAASIANELNAIENKPVEPVREVKVEEPISPVAPIVHEAPVREVVRPTPGPRVFSSVYINKPSEPTVVPEVKVEPTPVAPVTPVAPANPIPQANPGIELPKPAEMPILNKEVKEPVNPTPNVVPDFSQFEGESYDIK